MSLDRYEAGSDQELESGDHSQSYPLQRKRHPNAFVGKRHLAGTRPPSPPGRLPEWPVPKKHPSAPETNPATQLDIARRPADVFDMVGIAEIFVAHPLFEPAHIGSYPP